MKKSRYLYIAGIAAVLIIVGHIFYLAASDRNSLTETISTLKANYPELKDYPNDDFPQRSIRTEKAANGLYIAFVQEGSGLPITRAKCFFVKEDKTIQYIGDFNAFLWRGSDFSIRTCS